MLFTASPLSQTVTPSRTSSPLERDVLYGRPLICATYMYMYIDEVLHLYQHIRCEILLLFTRFQLGLASKYLTHLKRKHVLHHFVCCRPIGSFSLRTANALCERRAFAVVGPSAWHYFPLYY